jgi:hypothetical protein
MGKAIISWKLGDVRRFAVWSSIVDAPITGAMTRHGLEKWLTDEHGRHAVEDYARHIDRAEVYGTSVLYHKSLIDTVWLNRAGPGESWLSLSGIMLILTDELSEVEYAALAKHVVPDTEDTNECPDASWRAWCKASGIEVTK